jgi:hypothetical protein
MSSQAELEKRVEQLERENELLKQICTMVALSLGAGRGLGVNTGIVKSCAQRAGDWLVAEQWGQHKGAVRQREIAEAKARLEELERV